MRNFEYNSKTYALVSSLLIITAMLGSVLGYGKVYAFHLLLILFYFILIKKFNLITNKYTVSFLIFIFFATLSIAWAPNKINGALDVVLFLFQFSCIAAVIFRVKLTNELESNFKIIFNVLLANLYIGILEIIGIMRMPMSFYSPYANFFGRTGYQIAGLSEDAVRKLAQTPTGFNYNPNNFCFVMLLFLPFCYFSKSKIFRATHTPLIIFCILMTGSRGGLLALLSFFGLMIILEDEKPRKIIDLFAFIFLVIFIDFCFDIGLISRFYQAANLQTGQVINFQSNSNMTLTSLDSASANLQTEQVINFQSNSNMTLTSLDSASYRFKLYCFGIKSFVKTYGLGTGVGGISSLAAEHFGVKSISFHNYFLEQSINLGLFFVLFFSLWYGFILKSLFKISLSSSIELRYYTKSCFYALLIALVGSISPSSIIYELSYWIIIGFSISLLIYSTKSNDCNSLA